MNKNTSKRLFHVECWWLFSIDGRDLKFEENVYQLYEYIVCEFQLLEMVINAFFLSQKTSIFVYKKTDI